MNDLKKFEPNKPSRHVLHPLYDNFGPPVSKAAARNKLGLDVDGRIILFFGFIRHYKGLDMLLVAMADPRIREQGIRLLVAGEYYEDQAPYQQIIREKKDRRSAPASYRFYPRFAGKTLSLCSGCRCTTLPQRHPERRYAIGLSF